MVTWEPWLYTDPAGTDQLEYQLSKIINGDFDAYIKRWADDSKSWGHPYFLRFAAEMNGDWFPWSEQVNGNEPGEYVRAWRHVHTIFANEGVTNVTWVWSPNIEYDGSTPLEELYPGDDYVDWLGMDGYNWGTVPHRARTASLEGTNTNRSATVTGWQTFSQVFTQTYTHITALSTKPLMVAETASAEQGGSKANWDMAQILRELD
jgi:beta-mannanase